MKGGEIPGQQYKFLWERKRVVDLNAWQTEGSPLALFQTLRNTLISSGCSVESLNNFVDAGSFVEKEFRNSGKPLRQEEKKVEPVVHSYRVALRFAKATPLDTDKLPLYTTFALLHDVLEDTNVSFAELQKRFGEKVARGVALLSKHVDGKKFETEEYYSKLAEAEPEIRWIKVADRIENLSVFLRMSEVGDLLDTGKFRLPSGNGLVEAMKTNLEESQHYVVALAEGNPNLAKELQRVMLETEKRLKELQIQKKTEETFYLNPKNSSRVSLPNRNLIFWGSGDSRIGKILAG